MEAVGAQLQHGRHSRALGRAIQLLQGCAQCPALLLACAQSGQPGRRVYNNVGFCCKRPVNTGGGLQ